MMILETAPLNLVMNVFVEKTIPSPEAQLPFGIVNRIQQHGCAHNDGHP